MSQNPPRSWLRLNPKQFTWNRWSESRPNCSVDLIPLSGHQAALLQLDGFAKVSQQRAEVSGC